MDAFARRFVRAALCWLAVGLVFGVGMVFWPGTVIYRPAHVHANLLGFVSMMIFGVAYHVMPRFSGRPLYSPRLAAAHLVVANVGLAALVLSWVIRVHWAAAGAAGLRVGGTLTAIGTCAFIYNIWRTLDAPPVRVATLSRNQGAS